MTINGATYDYPETGDQDWGPDATDWAQAVTTGMLQKAGGLFQLLADVDFGTGFGVKSLYYKTRTVNGADAGQVRLARADVINWRNQANDGNLSLGVSTTNTLQFNGADIQSNALTQNHIFVGSAGGAATDVAMSGDATIVSSGALTIANNVVTNAKLATVATATFKGRTTAGTGNVEDLTATQATALLNAFVGDGGSGGTKGLVPAPTTGDASKFLKGDGTWSDNAGGDVVGPGSATDNALARFDSTTGKLIQNSVVTLGDSGNLTGIVDLTITGALTVPLTSGRIFVGNGSNISVGVAVSGDISLSNAGVTAYVGTVPATKGGTAQTSYTTGDIIYASSSNTLSKRAIGSTGDVLTVAGGVPTWAPIPGAGDYDISSSCGTFNTGSGTYVDVTNLSATITTTGRPVALMLVPDGDTASGHAACIGLNQGSGNTGEVHFQIIEGSTSIAQFRFEGSCTGLSDVFLVVPASSINHFYLPSAGTYTYKLQAKCITTTDGAFVEYAKLVAYEV